MALWRATDRVIKSKSGSSGAIAEDFAPSIYPTGKRWLPIMHLERDGWWFSALYANTARAHELGKTHDWVVIYYEREGHQRGLTYPQPFPRPG